ncbi:MAG: hypothetical protein AAF745_08355, partial [Planctomycetota bacterium]
MINVDKRPHSRNINTGVAENPSENTPFDFLIGFGGNDTLSGSGGIDILFGDSFSPVDGGFGND